MLKKLFWFCLILAAITIGWVMLAGGHGRAFCWQDHPINWTVGPVEEIVGLAVSALVLFLTAIILTVVLAGVGFILLGVFFLVGIILLFATLPITWPIFLLLFIVWLICASVNGGRVKS